MAKKLVDDLKAAGHTVRSAAFTHGGEDDLTPRDNESGGDSA